MLTGEGRGEGRGEGSGEGMAKADHLEWQGRPVSVSVSMPSVILGVVHSDNTSSQAPLTEVLRSNSG